MNMKMLSLLSILLLSALSAAEPAVSAPARTEDPVVVRNAPGQSYALYLPQGHRPEAAHPILYCFDPRGRGLDCLERFRTGAKRHGFIIASSNNSRSDGPMEPNLEAMKAIWKDTHARFAIDDRRAYATGFSGGSRVANIMAQVLGLAGVIGCGGGFPPSAPPHDQIPFAYFGMVGMTDFNYYEMRSLDATLERLSIPGRLEVFEGGHRWGPPELCSRALDWMQLRAMREGEVAPDPEFIAGRYEGELEASRELAAAGRSLEALDRLNGLIDDLAPLREVETARREVERLHSDSRVKRERKVRRRWDAWANQRHDRLSAVLERIGDLNAPTPTLRELMTRFEIPQLRRQAAREPGSESARAARRVLEMILVQTSFYQSAPLLAAGEFERAALCLEIACRIRPENPVTWYNLACARARQGSAQRALEALGKALERGFSDIELLRTDPDLENLRRTEGYREALERISAGAR